MKLTYEMAGFAEAAWEIIESNEPDISTERLMQMVADSLTIEYKREFNAGHVADLVNPNFEPKES